MLDEGEFGDAIGRLDQLRLGVAAGDDDMQAGAPRAKGGDDLGERQIVIAQRDVELVEHEQADRRVRHHTPGLAPRGLGRRDVARAVLRLPGEAFAHRAPLDLGPEAFDAHALAGRPGALDELHDADAKAPPEGAQGKPEGRGRLALAWASVNDEEALLQNRLRGDLRVLHGLALHHLGFVAVFFVAAHPSAFGRGRGSRRRRAPLRPCPRSGEA